MSPVKKDDMVVSIMERVMSTPVPDRGVLKHPLSPKPKNKNGQMTIADFDTSNLPENIDVWNTKHFVDYFAECYYKETGGNYRKGYKSDCTIISDILSFLKSNGLPHKEWCKKVIDWAFKRRDWIMTRKGHFTLTEIRQFMNYFYQDEVLPKVQTGVIQRDTSDTSLINEIDQAIKDGKERELFVRFGIPVAATYMVNKKGFQPAVVEAGVGALLKLLSSGVLEQEKLSRIVFVSVIGSPYPEEYVLRNWRELFSEHIKFTENEDWYRDKDYKGIPLSKYAAIL